MATQQDLIQKIQDLLNNSTSLSAATKANFDALLNSLIQQNAQLERFEALYTSIGDSIDAIRDNLNGIYGILKASVDELSDQDEYLKIQRSALNKLADIAKEVLSIRRGETELDAKRIEKLRLETTERIRLLEFAKQQPGISQAEIKNIDAQITKVRELYTAFDQVLKVDKEFNRELGLSPKIIAGMDKALSKLGIPSFGIVEALSETRKLHQEAVSTKQQFDVWKTFTGKVIDNFKDTLSKANLIQASIGFLIDALITGDKATGDLAKNFNLTYNEAANLRGELIEIGNLSGNVALNARALQESMVAVGKALGSNAMLNKEDLKTFTELREMAGYANEELIGMQKMSLAMNKPLKDNVKSFLGATAALNAQNKLTINEKQLLKEVADTSVAIKLSIGGTAEDLAKAAFRAKQFGINLEQADRIAESLLDFESSISNELSAELLTGRDLNLERARLLALNGSIAEASAEILRQVRSSAEFTAMNRIQQDAIAKAVGMSRDELAKSLVEREALNRLDLESGKQAQEKFNLLVKEKGYTEAVKEMGDDEYARQLKQQSIQERFNASVEKLKEIFVAMSEPILRFISPIVDTLLPVISLVSGVLGEIFSLASKIGKMFGGWTGLIIGLIPVLFKAGAIMTAIRARSIAGAIASIYSSFAQIPYGLGIPLAIAAISGLGALISSAVSAVSGPSETKFAKGGIVTGEINNATIGEAGPEAIIPLNSSTGKKILGGESTVNNNMVIQELKNLRQDINNLNNRPIHVSIDVDGQKLAAAVAQYPTTFNTNFNRKAVKT